MLAQPPRLSAFWTIGEVATHLDLPQHLLKFWEARIDELQPLRRGAHRKGNRLYSQDDIALINGIRYLIQAQGYSIRGVQRVLRERGVQAVRESVPAN